MLQSFECPNCQARLNYDAKVQSLTVRCDYCGSTVIVPNSLRTNRVTPSGQQTQALAEIVQLVQNGRKIEAVKLFRDTFNVGLKEAKDVVDAIERHEDIHLGGTNFHTEAVTVSTYSNTPTVRTSGRSCGCIFGVALLLLILGALAVLSVIPADNPELLERISAALEGDQPGQTESVAAVSTVDALVQEIESSLTEPEANSEAQFADLIMQFGGEEGIGPGFFNDTRRLAIDGEGNIYTGDYSGGRIQVFDATGKFLATWNAGEELYMTGMTADRSGTVYIINIDAVEKYNGLTGEFLGTLALPGGQRTYFDTAATGPDGSVYLVAEDRLVRLDNSGNIILDLADPFANIPNFATTQNDAAIDGAGNIYVLGSETIYKLNAQGQFVDQIGSKGDAEDQFFTSPRSIAVDGQGRIFVDDFWGIKVFEGNGRYLNIIDSSGVAFDMVITDENDLLIMDRNSNEVRKYQLNQ